MKKYEIILNDVRNKITSGIYKPNEKMPNEKQMMEDFSASRATVKRAIDHLVSEGLVVKIRGSGTYVKNFSSSEQIDVIVSSLMYGFTNTNYDKKIESLVLHFNIVRPSKYIASQLQISTTDFVYDIKRVRIANDEPHLIEQVYMPIILIPGITDQVINGSIFNYIENNLSMKIISAQRTVRATVPNEEDKKHLKISGDVVILEIEEVGYLKNGIPFEYTVARHRSDKHEEFYVTTRT